MSRIGTIARRTFLFGSLAIAGGVAFGAWYVSRPAPNPLKPGDGETSLNPFVMITAEGVTRRPIASLDGDLQFAELFFDNVRVPAADRLGEEGEGWKICMATAGFERGLMLRSPARYQEAAKRLIALHERHKDGLPASMAERVARCWMDADAYALAIYAMCSRLEAGGTIGPESSTNKIFWSELDIALHQTALDILGPRGELTGSAPDAGDIGDWLDGYVFSLAGPIYAGSNEIQRNIIAERMLGLPRK